MNRLLCLGAFVLITVVGCASPLPLREARALPSVSRLSKATASEVLADSAEIARDISKLYAHYRWRIKVTCVA